MTWNAHLDDLGISMVPWEPKRKLRLLNIGPTLQERLRELDITEAALRSLGTLEPEDQKRVVEAVAANPSLAQGASGGPGAPGWVLHQHRGCAGRSAGVSGRVA